jgi:hypothetical protein
MDIYVDAVGLKEYIKQFFDAIRKDHGEKNNSIFNLSFKNILLDKTFRSQELLWDIPIKQTVDKSIPLIERSLNRETGRDKMKQILDELFKEESPDFKENFNNWFNSSRIMPLQKEIRTRFQDESSISLAENVKHSNNPKSNIDIKRILYWLDKMFFVDKEILNRTVFTRDMKGWGILSHVLEQEKDIVIIDRFFFDEPFPYKKASEFIKEMCGKGLGEKRKIVIFYGYGGKRNKKYITHSESIEFTSSVNKERTICDITFIGLNEDKYNSKGDDLGWKKLHDRLIISNYRIICSGHSFPMYFGYNEKKEKVFSANGSMFMTIGSIADRNNEKVMHSVLDYLQNEVIDCKIEEAYYIYSNETMNRSNLLSLPNYNGKKR